LEIVVKLEVREVGVIGYISGVRERLEGRMESLNQR
jgi:hypothetical protein